MNFRTFKTLCIGLVLVWGAVGAQAAAKVATYSAAFLPTEDPDVVFLDGFGRGATSGIAPAPLRLSTFAAPAAPAATVAFVDTWNVDVSAIAPGAYSFESAVIDAIGSVRFNAVTFNFYDAAGAINTILFDLYDGGSPVFFNATQAVGSGRFTVLDKCGVASCIWIQLIGTRDSLAGPTDYVGDVTAAVVPEPSAYALMLFGLLAVGAWSRRASARRV